MKNWRDILVRKDATILESIKVIDAGAIQIALVVDDDRRLIGTVTDGDIRRAILRNVPLTEPVATAMNPQPTTVRMDEDRETVLAKMRVKQLRQIPVLDDDGRVVSVEVMEELLGSARRPNWVVLMAGGAGTRLYPLTEDCPKPLLKVGNKALLETIVENFVQYGFHRFFISVNYKAEMILEHFGDGSRWGIDIQYLHERRKLGTAGCLSLLPERPTEPFFVMNGDLLTNVNFNHLLEFHREHKAAATMCVREYDFQVPYGVVRLDEHKVLSIDEKPIHRFFVNAGIYVLEPKALDVVEAERSLDMTTLLETMMGNGEETSVFPIREYWRDIGRPDDFEQANGEFPRVFS